MKGFKFTSTLILIAALMSGVVAYIFTEKLRLTESDLAQKFVNEVAPSLPMNINATTTIRSVTHSASYVQLNVSLLSEKEGSQKYTEATKIEENRIVTSSWCEHSGIRGYLELGLTFALAGTGGGSDFLSQPHFSF